MSLITKLQAATGQKSLWEIVKQAGLSIVLDGNWGESVIHSGSTSTKFVGEDTLGNKYYEDLTRQYGRHRWVVYKDRDLYQASQVTADWHAWLHCISDDVPSEVSLKKKKYEIEYFANPSGTANKYLPKGSWVNPQQRNWRKCQYWVPPS